MMEAGSTILPSKQNGRAWNCIMHHLQRKGRRRRDNDYNNNDNNNYTTATKPIPSAGKIMGTFPWDEYFSISCSDRKL
jgi:hypothetical protein